MITTNSDNILSYDKMKHLLVLVVVILLIAVISTVIYICSRERFNTPIDSQVRDILNNILKRSGMSGREEIMTEVDNVLSLHPILHSYLYQFYVKKSLTQSELHSLAAEYRRTNHMDTHKSISVLNKYREHKPTLKSKSKVKSKVNTDPDPLHQSVGSQEVCCCCCGPCVFLFALFGLCFGSDSSICQTPQQVYGDLCTFCKDNPQSKYCPKFDPNKSVGEPAQYTINESPGSSQSACCSQLGTAYLPEAGSHICGCCDSGPKASPCCDPHAIQHSPVCPDEANQYKYYCDGGLYDKQSFNSYDAQTLCPNELRYLWSTEPAAPSDRPKLTVLSCLQGCEDLNEGPQGTCRKTEQLSPLAQLRRPVPKGNCIAMDSKDDADKCCNYENPLSNQYKCVPDAPNSKTGTCNAMHRACPPGQSCINGVCGDIKYGSACSDTSNMFPSWPIFGDSSSDITLSTCASYLGQKGHNDEPITVVTWSQGVIENTCDVGSCGSFVDKIHDSKTGELNPDITSLYTTVTSSGIKCQSAKEPKTPVKCSWGGSNNAGASCTFDTNCDGNLKCIDGICA